MPLDEALLRPGVMSQAMPGRRIRVQEDLMDRSFRFFDEEYGIDLGVIPGELLRMVSFREGLALVAEACREPTSLELLTYAQLTGPHVTGEMR